MADGTPCPVIDLAHARLLRQVDEALSLAQAPIGPPPALAFSEARVEGGMVVLQANGALSPDAAEAYARSIYMMADEARRSVDLG